MRTASKENGPHRVNSKGSQGGLVNTIWQQRIHEHQQSKTAEVRRQAGSSVTTKQNSQSIPAPTPQLQDSPEKRPTCAETRSLIERASELKQVSQSSKEQFQKYNAVSLTADQLPQKMKSSQAVDPEYCRTERFELHDKSVVATFSDKDRIYANDDSPMIPDSSSGATVESMVRPISSEPKLNCTHNPIPASHIRTLRAVYGNAVNLYRDVLNVSPDATERQIRIAYFRQGRMILTERELSQASKRRFEAISVTYEILSKWRNLYDSCEGDLDKLLTPAAEPQPCQTPAQTSPSPTPCSNTSGDNTSVLTCISRDTHVQDTAEGKLKQNDISCEHLLISKDLEREEDAAKKHKGQQQQYRNQKVDKLESTRTQTEDSKYTRQAEKIKDSDQSTKTVVDAIGLAKHLRSLDSNIVNNFLNHAAFEESLGGFVECLSHDEAVHKDDGITPKKNNTMSHRRKDLTLDRFGSQKDGIPASPRDVIGQLAPKDVDSEGSARNLLKDFTKPSLSSMEVIENGLERNDMPFDEFPSSPLPHYFSPGQPCKNEQKDKSALFEFSDDPFADLNITIPEGSELPPEFSPFMPLQTVAPNTQSAGLLSSANARGREYSKDSRKISFLNNLQDGLPAVDEKTPLQNNSLAFYQSPQITAPKRVPTRNSQIRARPDKSSDISVDTGIPIGTVDLKRLRSNMTANSGITFDDANTANEGTPTLPFCDNAFLDHVSVYFKQLSQDMTEFGDRVHTEMHKLGVTVGTTLSVYSQNASVGMGEIGHSMSQNWEQANQAIISSIKSMTDDAKDDDAEIQRAPTV